MFAIVFMILTNYGDDYKDTCIAAQNEMTFPGY